MPAAAKLTNSWKSVGHIWQRTKFLFSGAWLAGMVVLAVGARLAWIHLHYPPHFDEITAAYGADSLFYGTPQVNHAGNQFTFVKTSEVGYSLYLHDNATGQNKALCGENGQYRQHDSPDINAFPWAPDDNSFVYTLSNKLLVCSSATVEASAEMPIETNSITDLAWLNPAEFAYVTYRTNLWRAQKQADGQWVQHQVFSRNGSMSSLTTITGDTVAWLEGDLICRADVTSGTPISGSPISSNSSTTSALAPPKGGLALWLDASTLKQPDQSPVTHLLDLGPKKNDALENGIAPVFSAPDSALGLNGKGTIHFTSGGSVTNVNKATGLATRAAPGISGTAPRSVFVVMRHDTPQTSMMVNLGDASAKGSLFAIEVNDNSIYLPTGWQGADNRIKAASTNWNLLESIYDGTAQSGYVDGVLRGTTRRQLNTADKAVEIGLRTAEPNGANAKSADGDFAELLIYDRTLGTEERQQVEDYLSTKWFGREVGRASPNPFVWLDPKTTGLTGFGYSKDTGMFLLQSFIDRQAVLFQFDPNTGQAVKMAQADVFQSPQWSGAGESAYFRRDAKSSRIIFADASGEEKSRLLEHAALRSFKIMPGGKKLLILGTVSNEPSAGIWELDLVTRKLSPLVPYSDYPSEYATSIEPVYKTVKSSDGTNLVCAIFQPANFNPHKKYPLVIGDTMFTVAVNGVHGRQWVPCVAAGGAYVVIVERRGWFKEIEKWSEDSDAAYEALKPELNIDTSQIFLFGSSAETSYMDEMVTNSPSLWKGIILLNPGALPKFSRAGFFEQMPKILISSGADEGREQGFKRYQQDSVASGVMVEYILHSGEAHHIVNNVAQLERTHAIMDFIFKE